MFPTDYLSDILTSFDSELTDTVNGTSPLSSLLHRNNDTLEELGLRLGRISKSCLQVRYYLDLIGTT